jgi:hypothetical protein
MFLFEGGCANAPRAVAATGVLAAMPVPKLRHVLDLVAWDMDMSETPIKGRA